MHRKAQAEIALILGLLAIAAVIGIYSYSSLTYPSIEQVALTEEQKAVAFFVNDMVRDAALDTVSDLYGNGGYLSTSTPALGAVTHKGFGTVPYWQICDTFKAPDMESELGTGVKNYMMENLPATQDIGGRIATFSKTGMIVSTRMYDNKVLVDVTLPTVYEGSQIPQPYRVEVATKIGRIYDFARNFARMEADCRMLDLHLIKSLAQSNEFSRPCWIPFGVGNADKDYGFSWGQLADCMETHIKYSLANTQIGRDIPLNEEGKIASFTYRGWEGSATEFFFIPAILDYSGAPESLKACGETPLTGDVISSDRYNDLNVMFYFGDDDGLDRTSFAAPEHLEINRKTGEFMTYLQGMTVAEYSQFYSVMYPVIVTVWDDETRESFRFATFVYMEKNQVGRGCGTQPVIADAYQSQYSAVYDDICLKGATEDANIIVKYKDGAPVIGAEVRFFGCKIGTTGSGEPLRASIPPYFGAVTVIDGDNVYSQCRNYIDLRSAVIEIPRSGRYTFHFYEVPVTKSGSAYTLGLPSPATDRIDLVMYRMVDMCEPQFYEGIINVNADAQLVSMLSVDDIPIDEYAEIVGAAIGSDSNLKGSMTMEGFDAPATGSDIYAYVPVLSDAEYNEDDDLQGIRDVYDACAGLALLTTQPWGGAC